jgi:hypothetical protein
MAQLRSQAEPVTGWSIIAAELRIPRRTRFAAHRMIVIADPSGRALRQLNGLASWYDAQTGAWRHKPIGYLRADRLRGYDSRITPRSFMPIHGASGPDWIMGPALASGAAVALAAGLGRGDVEEQIAPALAAIRAVNALSQGPDGGAGLAYPFLGLGRNSNSFFRTLTTAMGFEVPRFARPALFAPGAGALLLSPETLRAIRASR